MKIINTQTLRYPMTPHDVFVEVGGGITLPTESYMPDGYARVSDAIPPTFDPDTHKLLETTPAEVNGAWTQTWQVLALTQEELDQRAADALVAIAQARRAKNDEINAARLAANKSTFTHAGKVIACDELSRSDIDGANGWIALYGVLPPGWPGGWKAVDNTYVPISSVADWKAFYTSMFVAGNTNFAHAQVLKNKLAEAETLAEIQAIYWGMP